MTTIPREILLAMGPHEIPLATAMRLTATIAPLLSSLLLCNGLVMLLDMVLIPDVHDSWVLIVISRSWLILIVSILLLLVLLSHHFERIKAVLS